MAYFNKYPYINEDKSAKSLSFSFTDDLAFINNDILNELKRVVLEEDKNVRVSLHSSPENSLHNMIIAQSSKTYNRPHKHKNKAETYHILYGEQIVLIFDDSGNVREKFMMSKEENMIYRFEKNTFHMTIPTTPCVIFHESKIGPFVRKGDSIWADWAPKINDETAIKTYIEKMFVN